LQRLRGVGNITRREIATAVKFLREQLGNPQHADVPAGLPEATSSTDQLDVGSLSVDLLAQRIIRTSVRDGEAAQRTLQAFLVVLGRNNPSLYTVNGRPLYVHLNGLAIVLLK
jgi:hypothetical protein